jgi:hypothetical protein
MIEIKRCIWVECGNLVLFIYDSLSKFFIELELGLAATVFTLLLYLSGNPSNELYASNARSKTFSAQALTHRPDKMVLRTLLVTDWNLVKLLSI